MRKKTGRNMSFIAVGMGAGVFSGHSSTTTSSCVTSSRGGVTLGSTMPRNTTSSSSISESLAPVRSIV